MRVFSLCSGSSGNCIYVGDGDTNILIDIGITAKKLKAGLAEVGLDISDITAVLITHEHSDHVKGIGVFNRKNNCKIYSKKETLDMIRRDGRYGKMDYESFSPINEDERFFVGDFEIEPFRTFHDAVSPVCYVIRNAGKKFAMLTDTGTFDEGIITALSDVDVLYIEANHDVKMLEMSTKYPYSLKMRILSDIGHLSNERSAELVCKVYHNEMKAIYLGHLSGENNMPEIAYETIKQALVKSCGVNEDELNIYLAKKDENSVISEL